MTELPHYVAVLNQMPSNAAGITECSWTLSILPSGEVVATKQVSQDDATLALEKELQRLLRDSDPTLRIVQSHLATVESAQPEFHASETSLPLRPLIANLRNDAPVIASRILDPSTESPASAPKKSATPDDGTQKQSEADASSASEKAQLIEKGLPALDLPEPLWGYLDLKKRGELAMDTARARLAYANRASWDVAPELELLDLVDRPLGDPKRTVKQNKASELLEERIRLAKAETDLSREDVFLKQERVKQQAIATVMLAEALKQSVAWRDLAKTGKRVLLALTVFAAVIVALLTHLLFRTTNSLDPWAYSVAVFALAVFALSPAALLIIERPLKGIDEWTPEGKSDAGQQAQSQASGAAAGAKNKSSKNGKSTSGQ